MSKNKILYIEPAEDRAVGNLFNFVMTLPPVVNTPPVSAQNRKKKKATSSGRNFRDGPLNLLEKSFFSREKTFAFLKLSMISREKNFTFFVLKSPKA